MAKIYTTSHIGQDQQIITIADALKLIKDVPDEERPFENEAVDAWQYIEKRDIKIVATDDKGTPYFTRDSLGIPYDDE